MLNPESPYQFLLADIQDALRKKKYPEALNRIRKAMGENMNAPEPHNLLGIYYELHGNTDSARTHYRVACDLDPSYLPAIRNLERLVMWRFARGSDEFDLGEYNAAGCARSRCHFDRRPGDRGFGIPF